MFSSWYFNARYWSARYWSATGAAAPVVTSDTFVHVLRLMIPIEQILGPMAIRRSGQPSFERQQQELDDEEALGVL